MQNYKYDLRNKNKNSFKAAALSTKYKSNKLIPNKLIPTSICPCDIEK